MATTAQRQAPPARAPGPKGRPVVGSILDFRRDILGTMIAGWRQYGDIVQFNVAGPAYLLAHPDDIQYVLRENPTNYPKAPFQDARWRKIVGEGIVTSKGEFWARQRRLADPAFHQDRIAEFGTIMTDATDEMLAEWDAGDSGRTLDVRDEMMRLTLTILARAMFSADVWRDARTIGDAVGIMLAHANNRLFSPIDPPEKLPLPSHRRYLGARDKFDAVIYRMIDERRAGEPKNDLLTMFIEARDAETGEQMDNDQVRDEVRTMFVAGHETTAVGLTWTFYLLSEHPEIVERLVQEIDEVVGDRVPTVDDLPNLRYEWRVIQESLRLYPPIWVFLRSPVHDDEIGGYRMKKGKNLFICMYITHRHPEFWESPESFDPDRFEPEKTGKWHRFQYVPFGGGPRKCIGNNFAIVEMQLCLARILQRYRLKLVPGFPVEPEPGLSLRQKHGMQMTLERVPGR
jgi:cytochrome P450